MASTKRSVGAIRCCNRNLNVSICPLPTGPGTLPGSSGSTSSARQPARCWSGCSADRDWAASCRTRGEGPDWPSCSRRPSCASMTNTARREPRACAASSVWGTPASPASSACGTLWAYSAPAKDPPALEPATKPAAGVVVGSAEGEAAPAATSAAKACSATACCSWGALLSRASRAMMSTSTGPCSFTSSALPCSIASCAASSRATTVLVTAAAAAAASPPLDPAAPCSASCRVVLSA
mmetsp:Transcript_4908/g.13384  ORF Transcript_4908/g.13384 Transcript_4908/m.13384 type:complete len:238 (-) Transcript_4908:2155-2868(-)